ncbi:hypothetical protein FHX49_000673 [Microbacterium endophyticum]|uniref:Uncharacterized protein n=1 Tax=Microbacterium endophyticum TaxID=1526412 RepID=A0A7W4V1J9_9MICO|nr:DUF4244 domain-containing protein [Microbacterium endophyticum]MBB2975132.1 hypothetical protein [Microbacterium endophyticum]NIK37328.1 hypothetical protein [Microbacterium endophyticum]
MFASLCRTNETAVPKLSRRRAERLYRARTARQGIMSDDEGAATAEYAIATMAAVNV